MQKSLKTLFGVHHGLDEKSVDFLISALEKNNLPGFDYIEFKQSLGNLAQIQIDEPTALKSAFATAATVGLTKEKLLATAEHYKKLLTTEKSQFDVALQKQIEQRVNSKQTEVEKLRKQIEEYASKIKELETKISQAQSTIEQADDLINAAKERIETTKDGFEATLRAIMNEIDRDIMNIQQYL
jgi:chromosome segregation ATPase